MSARQPATMWSVWYPFKFRGRLSYSTVVGMLAEEVGDAPPSTWKRRRRWRLARQNDPDFPVAAVHHGDVAVVEAWTDTPDHRFASVVVRSQLDDGVSVWTESRILRGGFRLFRLEPGQTSTELAGRSGRMIGWSTLLDGRAVRVLHPEGLPAADISLRLTPLRAVTDP